MERSTSVGRWLRREFFLKGLSSPAGLLFLFGCAILISWLIHTGNFLVVGGIIGALIGSMVLYVVIFKPLAGYYVVTFIAFFAFYPEHILHINLGLSTVVEVLVWFLFLGALREKPPKGVKNNLLASPITTMFLIYFFYNIIQYFNPELKVRTAYFFVMRKFFMFLWIYIISYRLINTPARLKFFLKFWVVMAVFVALYGCYQQWFGLLPQELEWVKSDPLNYALMFQGGQLRKFSILSDVVQFAAMSGSFCVLVLILAIHTKQRRRKVALFLSAIFLALGMSYTGTRTATFMLPIGMALYILMTIRNKTTLVTIFASIMVALFVMFAPIYSNKTLNRLRTSFETKDASLNVRDANRHFIQPYIYKHPLGGGVGMTGNAGYQLDPTHYLADFPPDSGLLEIALEVGWIGLTITVIWYLVIMYYYVYTAFRIRNKEFKIYTIAIAAALLSLFMTQYSQMTIGQIPLVIFYLSAIALVKRLLEFERAGLYDPPSEVVGE